MRKRFGQHFLAPAWADKVVRAIAPSRDERFLEIGPGPGALTLRLAPRVEHLTAIEIDRDLAAALQPQLPPHAEIVVGDILDVDFAPFLAAGPLRVAGNLPYNIATPLLKRFIEHRDHIQDVTVMVQKEVAERLIAEPSTREYGPLSVLVQYYAVVKYGFTVARGSFKPPPKVESAVIRLEWKPDVPDARQFTDFVHHAFGSRRKKLVNNLTGMFGSLTRDQIHKSIVDAGIPENARPEDLSVSDFLRVYNLLKT